MKKTIATLLILFPLSFIFAGQLFGQETSDKQQRFQLFNAEYNSTLKQVSKTTVFLENRLFKIDTKTGDTWMLIDVLQEGKDIKYWKKITENPER